MSLHFKRHNMVVIDTTHGLLHFGHLTMQVKSAASKLSVKPQVVLSDDALTISLTTPEMIRGYKDHLLEMNTTCTVTPLEKFTEQPIC